MSKNANLECTVMVGQFSDEVIVKIDLADGCCSFFAPEDLVTIKEAPSRDNSVTGTIKVKIIEDNFEHAMVYLPRSSEQGRYITVKKTLLN